MKNKKLPILFALLFLTSCQKQVIFESSGIKVTFLDDERIQMEQKSFEIEKGNNLTVEFTVQNGFSFKSCSYFDYQKIDEDYNKVKLTLNHISYPQRIKINLASKDYTIEYHLNQGSFFNNDASFSSFAKYYDLSHHKRANTEQGYHFLKRKGYVLRGWNTKEDGSGTKIGLGSKVGIEKGKILPLYADWEKETSLESFEYKTFHNIAILTKYIGDDSIDKLVIPEEIGNCKVVSIEKDFASSLSLRHLLLPGNLKTIKGGAFKDCNIDEITLPDSIEEISSYSFSNRKIKTWHINANTPPKTVNRSDTSIFSEDMENIILNQDKKKLVLFGGCSMSYGIDSNLFQDAFKEYQICNMGVIGGSTASSQFDIITHFLSKGDIFLHAPEVCSQFQLMDKDVCEPRMFELVEGNYDLLSYCDMSAFENAFDIFNVYLNVRRKLEPDSYENFNPNYNQFGDYALIRYFQGENKSHNNYQYVYDPGMVNENSMKNLYSKYKAIQDKGCQVLFSYSPVNQDGIDEESKKKAIWNTFSDNIQKYLEKPYGIPVISKVETYLMEGQYFYDTDYHLTTQGAIERSHFLIEDIKKFKEHK